MFPTLYSFYIADIQRPTEPVKRICYADDITVWASGVKISELEHMINGYLAGMSCFLQDNSLFISAPNSRVLLFTPDPMQAKNHPKIKFSGAEISLSRNPKLLGVPYFHLMLIAYKWPTESVNETMSCRNWQAPTRDNKGRRCC